MSTMHQRTVKHRHMVREGGGCVLMQHAGTGRVRVVLVPHPSQMSSLMARGAQLLLQ